MVLIIQFYLEIIILYCDYISGANIIDYEIQHKSIFKPGIFSILNHLDIISPPKLDSIRFTKDYTEIYIVFNAPSDMANLTMVFDCSLLLHFNQINDNDNK